MIQTNQYRLGNYMRDKLTGEWMIIEDLSLGNVAATVINRAKFPLPDGWQMEPVPLSDDHLKRMGLSVQSEMYRLPESPCYLICSYDVWHFVVGYKVSVEIEYVHQLQNLFFAITGREISTVLQTN